MRMLLSTRHIPADPQYNVAINLIPAEFNDNNKVMEAWRAYHAVVREPASEAQARRAEVSQAALIFSIMRSLGLKLSEGDIQVQAYISQGYADRDKLYLDSLQALIRLANAMEQQRALTQIIVDSIPGRATGPKVDDT